MIGAWFGRIAEGQRIQPGPRLNLAINIGATILLAYTIWYALFAITARHFHGAIFWGTVLPVLFITVSRNRVTGRIGVTDWLLAVLTAACGLYFVLNDEFYRTLLQGMTPIPDHEKAIGVLALILTAEASRRALGWGLTSVLVLLLVYTWFGQNLPGELGHAGTDFEYFITIQTVTTEGLFGGALEVAATYAVLFITFGTFFQRTGGGDLFFELAAAINGRSRGGASKARVVASGLYGSISGSPVADVATTGPITIPLMRRLGVRPHRAAGIEAAASCGGAILPPVMGAVAFLMVEYTGIPYREIILAAIVPALLYYTGIFLTVHMEAGRSGEAALEGRSIGQVSKVILRHWRHVLTIGVLVFLLVTGLSPTYVAGASLSLLIVLSWTSGVREERLGIRGILECSGETIRQIAPLTAAVAASGIIIGCISLTGLTGKFSLLITGASGGHIVAVLLVSAVLLVLLGMGMPTPSVYILGAALIAPVLIQAFGIPPMRAHLFMVFFASMSAITPPLAVACFASAAIAQTDPVRCALYACRVGFAGFVIPFFFVFNPGILFRADWIAVVSDIAIAVLIVVGIALAQVRALGGGPVGWLRAGLLLLGCAGLFFDNIATRLIGGALVLGLAFFDPLGGSDRGGSAAQAKGRS